MGQVSILYWNVAQASKATAIPVQSIRKMIRNGLLPAYKVNGHYLLKPNEVDCVISAHRTNSADKEVDDSDAVVTVQESRMGVQRRHS